MTPSESGPLITRRDRVEGADHVAATLVLNRPDQLNAIDWPMLDALDAALDDLAGDPSVRGVIVTGAGRAFSAGGDLQAIMIPPEANRPRIVEPLDRFSKPIIAAINGLAYGGAALLSSSLDLRIGCEKTQFRFLAASYGRVNSSWSLPAQVGIPKAKELLFTGRVVGVEEAERFAGLDRLDPQRYLS